ncbi:UBA-like protein [Cynara cardunculus var. scolymus]|uniref:UBA-like protein n=1 Tax=Cynara cardunculus var. scolymus TaxID=59895 RepID=A0A124SCH2_CYNCS|nr:UBA-like protein [Cynara cardunculus var. scolymus]
MAAKLKIAGAWSGVLEAELEAWTVPLLKEQIASRLNCSKDSINLISAGKVLRDDDGAQNLIELGVKNNSKILVTRVSPDQGKELIAEEEKSSRLQRLKAAATSLAKRHADGLMPVEDFNLELENQSGEKVQLGSENDQRALMMGLMFHGKAKRLVKSRKYEDAMEVLTMGELIDNVPILQIDMVWCYFMLKDISKLSVAGKRLEDARKGIERSHGKQSSRLRVLHGNSHPELALGDIEKAKKSLNSARSRCLLLQVPDEELSLLMGMGYGERSAKRALRMNNQDVERAKAVDLQKLKELVSIGFDKELAAESLRRNENETQRALDDLTNPDTNSDIQLFIESRKKKRLRQTGDAAIEKLTSMGFARETVVAAVRAYGTEELALNHLLEESVPNGDAPANNIGSTSGGGPLGAGETIPNDGDLSSFEQEIDRDVEMEEELTEDLQSEDAFSDYDMELTKETEAIEEYLGLVSV